MEVPTFASQMIFHPGNCINAKKPFASVCRQCVELCPHDAVSEIKKVDPGKCTDCGVCMAVCPSDGFVDRTLDDLHKHIFEADRVVINCPAAQPGTHEIGCIGMFDRDVWSVLMLLSDRKEVRVLTGDCAACEDLQACARSISVLQELLRQWTLPNKLKIEITPWDGRTVAVPAVGASVPSDPPAPQTVGELREKKKLKDKLKAMLPPLIADETYAIPRARQWLLEALEPVPEHKIPFPALKISEQCSACGVCARVCPQDALTHTREPGLERFIYRPSLCVHCQRCVKACGSKAVSLENMPLNARYLQGNILLREIRPRFCASCGHQIFHKAEPGLCISCARKDPELKGILY